MRWFALLLLAIAGCRTANPELYPRRLDDPYSEIIVLDNHWHTALIFHYDDLPAKLRDELHHLGGTRYVAFGWGDEGFFRAERITPGLILQAMFYSRGSVMLVSGFDSEPEGTFDEHVDIYRIPTRPEGLTRIIGAVSESFAWNENHLTDSGPGIDLGRFYEARGRYAFYRTCNQWVAYCLAEGGLPITPCYATGAGNVAFQVKRLNEVRLNGSALIQATGPGVTYAGRCVILTPRRDR